MRKMKFYTATVKHDRGTCKITVTAFTKKAAKYNVMVCEGCPERAITIVQNI